jgi:hypothetical protein
MFMGCIVCFILSFLIVSHTHLQVGMGDEVVGLLELVINKIPPQINNINIKL